MKQVHLPATATPAEVNSALREHGYVIVDDLAPLSMMDQIDSEIAPHVERSPVGEDNFTGKLTRRTGSLIERSPMTRELIMNPTALGAAGLLLGKATTFQLNVTQVISVFPGSQAQPIHRDEDVWDFFPFPSDYDVQCNILWALSDYTDEMGATRIVPGSHVPSEKKYSQEESVPAEMSRGSALFYTGKVYHGAGENRSQRVRQALNITYVVGWLRQEENQYLATPLEVARTLPDDLLKVMGYQVGCFPLGCVGDFEDPMSVLRPSTTRTVLNISMLNKQAANKSGDAASIFQASVAS